MLRARRREERGAAAVVLAVMVTVIVAIAALAVDLGVQRVARRDMQAIADVVAMDMARTLRSRPVAEVAADPTWPGELRATLERQGWPAGTTVSLRSDDGTYLLATHPADAARQVRVWPARPGPPGGDPLVRASGTDVPTGVLVTSGTSVDFAFATGSGGASRDASAQTRTTACFSVGSYAARLRSGDSSVIGSLNQLARLLTGVDLAGAGITAVGYQGLAAARISLLELVNVPSLGVASVQELLALPSLTIGQLNAATLTALQNQTPPNTAAITALGLASATLGPVAATPIRLLDVLQVTQGDDSALGADISVLDLLGGQLAVADTDNFVALNRTALNLPILGTGASGSLTLIERPQRACGEPGSTSVQTSQARIQLSGTLADVNLPAGLIGLTARSSVNLDVRLAEVAASLTAASCGAPAGATVGSPDRLTIAATPTLAPLTVSIPVRVTGDLNLLVGRVAIDINLVVGLQNPPTPGATTVNVVMPNHVLDQAHRVGGSGTGLGGLSVSQTGLTVSARLYVLGVPLTPITLDASVLTSILAGVTSSVVNPLISGLDAALIAPLTNALGVDVAGGDVFVGERPDCSGVRLVG